MTRLMTTSRRELLRSAAAAMAAIYAVPTGNSAMASADGPAGILPPPPDITANEKSLWRTRLNIHRDWKFTLGDLTGAEAVDFVDEAWNAIGLPLFTTFL
ncbi:MAG: hypothetical protein ACP5I8_09905 [Phycisphaerae bacterium]